MEQTPQAPTSSPGGLAPNVAAALAYLWVVAIVWLVLEPYNKDRFIRFHSFQALMFGVATVVLSMVLGFIPIIGWIALLFLPLAVFILWVICVVKAYQNKWFKLPWIGDFAERQAGPA